MRFRRKTAVQGGSEVVTEHEIGVATKSELAYARVREMVLGGELEPGSVLNQATLARRIGVSTTPLREALRRLAQQGLVELGAHRDARVAPLDAAEARDLLELRQDLDPLGAGHLLSVVGQQAAVANTAGPGRFDTAFGHYTFAASLGQALGPALITVVGGAGALPDTRPIFIVAAGLAVGEPLTMSWLAAMAAAGLRGRAMSLRLTGNRLGQVLIPSTVGLLAAGVGSAGVLWATAGALALAGAAARRLHVDGGP